jgi:hypothetical protein
MGVKDTGTQITTQMMNAPLPEMIERLGLSIAKAQAALDRNSIDTAVAMAQTEVTISDQTYNLLSLGFTPSFYAFTEAKIEAKLSFSMTQERSFGGKISGGVNYGVVAASLEASYSQKFSMEASGSSSVAARLVAVPPPDVFRQILEQAYQRNVVLPEPVPASLPD